MTTLEKKVDALCRLSLAPDDSEFTSAMEELRQLMAEPQTGYQVTSSVKQRVQMALTELGVNHGIVGRKYLEDAVELTIHNPDLLKRITRPTGLYHAVADVNGTTPARAERSIRHGIENGWMRADPDVLFKYFGNTVHPDKGKPTNREFVAAVAQYIQREI